MSGDFIPRAEDEFVSWLNNFMVKMEANKTKLGVTDPQIASLTTLQTTYRTAVKDAAEAKVNLDAKVQGKRLAYQELVAEVRSRVRQMQAEPSVTDVERAELGIALRDVTPTPPAVPTTRPVVTVDTSERQRHRLDYRDIATPTRRAKPDGVAKCEIRSYVGSTPPSGLSQFTLLTIDVTTPYIVEYEDADAGKTAYYILRWLNSQDESGPWSETASATITG